MSPRTGRPKSDNPRNKSLNVRLTQDELDLLQECAEKLNKTRTDTIVFGLYLIKNGQNKRHCPRPSKLKQCPLVKSFLSWNIVTWGGTSFK